MCRPGRFLENTATSTDVKNQIFTKTEPQIRNLFCFFCYMILLKRVSHCYRHERVFFWNAIPGCQELMVTPSRMMTNDTFFGEFFGSQTFTNSLTCHPEGDGKNTDPQISGVRPPGARWDMLRSREFPLYPYRSLGMFVFFYSIFFQGGGCELGSSWQQVYTPATPATFPKVSRLLHHEHLKSGTLKWKGIFIWSHIYLPCLRVFCLKPLVFRGVWNWWPPSNISYIYIYTLQ